MNDFILVDEVTQVKAIKFLIFTWKLLFQSCQPLKREAQVFPHLPTFQLQHPACYPTYSLPHRAVFQLKCRSHTGPNLRKRKNKGFFAKWMSKQEEKMHFPTWRVQLHFPCLPALRLPTPGAEPSAAAVTVSKRTHLQPTQGRHMEGHHAPCRTCILCAISSRVCLRTVLPKAKSALSTFPVSLLINAMQLRTGEKELKWLSSS